MKRSASLLILALVLFAAGCGGNGDGQPAGQAEPGDEEAAETRELSQETIRVSVGIDSAYAPMFVAKREGLFEDEGINVELVQFAQGGEGVDAMLAGEIHAGGSGDATVLGKAPRGDLRALAVFQESGDYIKAVVRDEIDDVSEIRRMGIVPGSLSEYGAVRLLEYHDIPEGDVEFVPSGPPELPVLLQRGDVDGFVIWEPWPSRAEDLGGKVLMRTNEFDYSYVLMLIASGQWLDGHREEAKALIRAIARANEMVEDDPDLAAEATRAEVRVEEEETIRAVEQIDFRVRGLNDDDRENFESIAQFLLDRNIVDTLPNVDELIVEDIVDEALEER